MDYSAIREAFARTHHCVIATASPDGAPWLSTVFFNYDASYTLVWESTRHSRHSILLQSNPRISVCIPHGDKVSGALYASGAAREAAPSELPGALDTFLNGPHQREDPQRSLADYGPESPIALYLAELDKLFSLEHTNVGGYVVEEREPINLDALRKARV